MFTALPIFDSLHFLTHDLDRCGSSPLPRDPTHTPPVSLLILHPDSCQPCPPEAPSIAQLASGARHHHCDLQRCTPSASPTTSSLNLLTSTRASFQHPVNNSYPGLRSSTSLFSLLKFVFSVFTSSRPVSESALLFPNFNPHFGIDLTPRQP